VTGSITDWPHGAIRITGTPYKIPMADDQIASNRAYWRANLKWVGILMTIWFIVSYGCGILFVNQLNEIKLGGFKLGFWFAQQGSIYVFVILIAVYVKVMNGLDRKYGAKKS
jgi:putative solute:sodium symporter small subunit